jgi:2-polyprenyl-3-methyl-5-hydroxy-6-metoxy-1,4-benzoquinol methylase
VSTLHELALRQYTEHYARMNPTLHAASMPERSYRNMELMFGGLVEGLAEGDTVADVGCGAGFLLHWLARRPKLSLSGVDISEGQIALAQIAAPKAQVERGDAIKFLESREGCFNGIFCFDVLEHMEKDTDCLALLQGIHNALKPGGFFVCRVPNAAHVLGSYSRYLDITHHRGFTSGSLQQALTASGFGGVSLIRTRSSSLLGQFRLVLEHCLHRSLFLVSGYTAERTFTQNVTAIGFK